MLRQVVPAVLFVALLSSAAMANPFSNTPLDPGTWNPGDWVKPPADSGSSLQVVTPPFIDANGYVWSGSGSGGGSGKRVRKASIKYVGQRAYWYSNYRNNYGRVQDRRASKHDRIVIDTTVMSARTKINPSTGEVRRYVYRNGSLRSSSRVGWAQLRYQNGNWGRAYYAYGSQTVWANRPARPQPGFAGNNGFPNPSNFPQQQQNNNSAGNIAQGILQIIQGAAGG